MIFNHQKSGRRRILLFIFLSPCFYFCGNPVEPINSIVPWDTSFVVGEIKFPNDTIYAWALTGFGSNWRMHQFLDKCKSQRTVNVGFIGGSITAGAGASAQNLRYSSLFCSAIKSSFPNLENVVEINAGIGATDSRFGCSRVNPDLLSFSPDLIIIEFAINDVGIGDTQYIHSTIEGLVRQCLLYKKDVPTMLLFMAKGDGTNVQSIHADVGSYYSLPMISYRDAIWPIIQSDWNYWNSFFYNDPHPNDTGHKVCAELLYSYLKNAINAPEDAEIPVPLFRYSDLYQYARIMTSTDSIISVAQSSWTLIPEEKGRIGFISAQNLDSLTLLAQCKEVTLCIETTPTNVSCIRITVDNGLVDTLLTDFCQIEYLRMEKLYSSTTASTHTIRIKHLDNSAFTIEYVLYAN